MSFIFSFARTWILFIFNKLYLLGCWVWCWIGSMRSDLHDLFLIMRENVLLLLIMILELFKNFFENYVYLVEEVTFNSYFVESRCHEWMLNFKFCLVPFLCLLRWPCEFSLICCYGNFYFLVFIFMVWVGGLKPWPHAYGEFYWLILEYWTTSYTSLCYDVLSFLYILDLICVEDSYLYVYKGYWFEILFLCHFFSCLSLLA